MRRFASLALVLSAFAAPLAAPLVAQTAHPDFSGKWALDPKSVDSPMAPTGGSMIITQDAKTLKMDQTVSSGMGDQKALLVFNLDGTETKNNVNGGGMSIDLASTAAWDGAALVVKTSADIQGQTLTQTERWTMDADGKTLRVTRDAAVAGQTMSVKMAFLKQ